MRKFNPIELASSDKKSRVYFRHIRWKGKRRCPRCGHRLLYYLYDDRFGCKRCRYKFGEFTGTYLGVFNFSLDVLVHLIYLFALGVPAYRIRWYISVSLATIERTFRVLRQSIYDESLQKLKELKLSGQIEIDEALFGGHKKGKRGWGAEGKTLVFGISQRNGNIITPHHPVLDRKHDTLVPLITEHTKKGSLYYSDDHTAYTTLNLIGKHQVVAHVSEEYVRDNSHINGIEGFWSYAKTWLYHYRGVPKQYFHLYLKEIEFRFNHRQENVFRVLTNIVAKTVPNV
ncbi:MAG: IS1595 family transposase [Candidatus Nitrosopolaris sp.]